jgi:hypothetical protein
MAGFAAAGALGVDTAGFLAALAAGLRAAVFFAAFFAAFFAVAALRPTPALRAADFAATLRLSAADFFAFLAFVFFAFFDFLAVAMTSSCFRCYATTLAAPIGTRNSLLRPSFRLILPSQPRVERTASV